MSTLNIDLETAKSIYPTKSEALNGEFRSIFGKDHFKRPFNTYTDIICYEDACEYFDIVPAAHLPYPDSNDPEDIFANTDRKLSLIAKAINVLDNSWTPDWDNSNQYKYYPWFDMRNGGVGCSDTTYGGSHSISRVGSRFCFSSEKIAKYFGMQFIDLYKIRLMHH